MAQSQPASAATAAPLCFVISPIGKEDSEPRKTADKVLKHVIAKALGEKYRIQRADEISKPGLITAQIVERLLGAPLVVADLTGGNENVYYELAIRHAANKPVIHIIAAGEDAPFDVKDMRFIPFDLKDPDSIDKAQEEIRKQADAIAKGEKPITPVQVAQILAQPSDGKDDTVRLLQALYSAVSGLQEEVRETKEGVQILENELLLSSGYSYIPSYNALRRANLTTTGQRLFGRLRLSERIRQNLYPELSENPPPPDSPPVGKGENK